jgi:hypothetical protein
MNDETLIDDDIIQENDEIIDKSATTPGLKRGHNNQHDFDTKKKFKPLDDIEDEKQKDISEEETEEEKKEETSEEDKEEETSEEVQEKPQKKEKKKEEEVSKKQKKQKLKIPDYDSMTEEEQARRRRKFKAQFLILHDTWGNNIPEIDKNMSLYELHELYETYIKNIHIKDSSGKYKVYLIIMWLIIELACTKMGLHIQGYTMSQFKSMNKYERLLLELGEKNYKTSHSEMSDWPVEMNILFMALVNAVTFIVIKMLSEYINPDMAEKIINMMTSFLSGDVPQPGHVLFGGDPKTEYDGISETPRRQMQDPINMLMSVVNGFMNQPKTDTSKPQSFKPVYND